MTTSGIYYFTAEVTDDLSNIYTDTIAIVMMYGAQLDALFKAKWNGMKTALINGDIEKALTYHQDDKHEKYSAIYNALGTALPSLAGQMQEITPIVIEGFPG